MTGPGDKLERHRINPNGDLLTIHSTRSFDSQSVVRIRREDVVKISIDPLSDGIAQIGIDTKRHGYLTTLSYKTLGDALPDYDLLVAWLLKEEIGDD